METYIVLCPEDAKKVRDDEDERAVIARCTNHDIAAEIAAQRAVQWDATILVINADWDTSGRTFHPADVAGSLDALRRAAMRARHDAVGTRYAVLANRADALRGQAAVTEAEARQYGDTLGLDAARDLRRHADHYEAKLSRPLLDFASWEMVGVLSYKPVPDREVEEALALSAEARDFADIDVAGSRAQLASV